MEMQQSRPKVAQTLVHQARALSAVNHHFLKSIKMVKIKLIPGVLKNLDARFQRGACSEMGPSTSLYYPGTSGICSYKM